MINSRGERLSEPTLILMSSEDTAIPAFSAALIESTPGNTLSLVVVGRLTMPTFVIIAGDFNVSADFLRMRFKMVNNFSNKYIFHTFVYVTLIEKLRFTIVLNKLARNKTAS
jgi:hypothetical protein